MGCFSSTCAFTRTAVENGDEVLFVGVRPRFGDQTFNTYDLLQNIWSFEGSWEQHKRIIKLTCERNGKDYTEQEEKEDKIDFWKHHPIRFAVVGKYNDYGSIDDSGNPQGFNNAQDLDKENDWTDWQFFVHQSVAEKVLGFELNSSTDLYDAVKKLVYIARYARIQLSGHFLLGTQQACLEEFQMQRTILELAKNIIDAKEQEIEERFKEFDDEE